MNSGDRLPRRLLLCYGLPGLILGLPTIPVYVYLPPLYADDLGLGLASVGGVLLAARTLDMLTDPLAGWLSDRVPTRFGRRKPWIAVGAVLAAAGLIALFDPPAAVTPGYLLIWSALLYLGWTFVAVPYTAWGAELSADYHERSRITAAREGMMLAGVMLAGALPAVWTGLGGSERGALAATSWIAVALALPAVALLLLRVPEVRPAGGSGRGRGLRPAEIVDVFRNRPFLRLLAAWFVNGLANGLPAGLFLMFMEHALEAGATARGVLTLLYFAAAVGAIPLWLAASRRLGKHRTWCVAMLLACAAFAPVPLLGAGDVALFAVVCIATGLALGADLALPPAMQADVIDLDRLRHGAERAGLHFALWSMATKLALAAAVGLAFPALGAFGFDPKAADHDAGGLLALAMIYAGVPVVLKLIAIAVVWGHPLDARRQAIVRRRLDQRRRTTRGVPA